MERHLRIWVSEGWRFCQGECLEIRQTTTNSEAATHSHLPSFEWSRFSSLYSLIQSEISYTSKIWRDRKIPSRPTRGAERTVCLRVPERMWGKGSSYYMYCPQRKLMRASRFPHSQASTLTFYLDPWTFTRIGMSISF